MEFKKITINPRIIKHLGKDLITSSEVAVVELVKNSVDAKADNIHLYLYDSVEKAIDGKAFLTPVHNGFYEFIPAQYHGLPVYIIEDDGNGMNNNQLDRGFLEIGTDLKLDHSESGTILGEKGIGRLATQRLGRYLIVETASRDEQFGSLTLIDWDNLIQHKSSEEVPIPYQKINSSGKSYTRLWVIGININDFLEVPGQISFEQNYSNIMVKNDLMSALNFLISPFDEKSINKHVRMFYNDATLDIEFPHYILNLAESIHAFSVNVNKGRVHLKYSLDLKPWFLERMHRHLVKPEAFRRLHKSHGFYKELLESNIERFSIALKKELYEPDILDLITDDYEDNFADGIKDKNSLKEYARQRAASSIKSLRTILPVKGDIYSFKQNVAVGDKIIIESVKELVDPENPYTLRGLKSFLDNYNGIKLYRGIYRIGFLGGKESDWLKLQQFRTKGQQFYRFDLGNTLGYVSLNDPAQKNIQEISSRLDISQNRVSDSFKQLATIIFNKLFYDLNRTANSIVTTILKENGLLGESIATRVQKNTDLIKKMIRKNEQMLEVINSASSSLNKYVSIDGESVSLPKSTFDFVSKAFEDAKGHFKEDQKTHTEAVNLLAEADEQLKAIEVETYNNYKLMANGLITETITHELHSLSKTGIDPNINTHFDFLKTYFMKDKFIRIYNQHVNPVKNGYHLIAGKMLKVSDLYSFLENTFIKKGTYDEFIYQNISDLVDNIEENLIKITRENKITIECTTSDLKWFVPKGVLLHVFYNLFNNSIYWIDARRKFAQSDPKYFYDGKDKISIEEYSSGAIIVSDTGTGVLRSMEDILFDPLQSGKPHQEGRGMGLYIVKKLLNSFNADIELLPDRNSFGNRFKFLITLEDRSDM